MILPFDVFQFGPIEVNLLELFYAMLLTSSMIMNDWGKVYERRILEDLFFEKSNPKKAVLFSVLASLKGSCDAKQTAS